jgi:hypothetical protein
MLEALPSDEVRRAPLQRLTRAAASAPVSGGARDSVEAPTSRSSSVRTTPHGTERSNS